MALPRFYLAAWVTRTWYMASLWLSSMVVGLLRSLFHTMLGLSVTTLILSTIPCWVSRGKFLIAMMKSCWALARLQAISTCLRPAT